MGIKDAIPALHGVGHHLRASVSIDGIHALGPRRWVGQCLRVQWCLHSRTFIVRSR